MAASQEGFCVPGVSETHPCAVIMLFFALVWTFFLTLAVRSILYCLCCDVEDFTHLFLLLMIASMFSNSIHGPDTHNNKHHCNMNKITWVKTEYSRASTSVDFPTHHSRIHNPLFNITVSISIADSHTHHHITCLTCLVSFSTDDVTSWHSELSFRLSVTPSDKFSNQFCASFDKLLTLLLQQTQYPCL
jgi:hypothetical protein